MSHPERLHYIKGLRWKKEGVGDRDPCGIRMNKKTWIYANLALLMAGLGCSDALRGVFAPVFQSHFGLSAGQLSIIVTVSYVGNLLFMLFGSSLVDRYPIKKVFLVTAAGWCLAAVIYLTTDSYYALLLGVLIAMGTSTLLNTFINFMTPMLFLSPSFIINTLFFVQGIGTTGTQSVIGRFATSFQSWKIVNACLLAIGILTLLGTCFMKLEEPETDGEKTEGGLKERTARKPAVNLLRVPAFWYFFFVFGFYFIGEHGVMNWMSVYCINALGVKEEAASMYAALFFGGMTLGRLLLAPVVQKMGILESIQLMGGVGAILYTVAIFGGNRTLLLLGFSGFLISILYPTLVMSIQLFFEKNEIGKATGMIISAATLFDIGFNTVFGLIIDRVGYHAGMRMLPVAMLICAGIFILLKRNLRTVRAL